MLLICETCHRYWKLPRGHIRRDKCPRCQRWRRSIAAKRREALKQEARQIASAPRTGDLPPARCPTPDELRQLMDAADAASARALAAARTIATRFKG